MIEMHLRQPKRNADKTLLNPSTHLDFLMLILSVSAPRQNNFIQSRKLQRGEDSVAVSFIPKPDLSSVS